GSIPNRLVDSTKNKTPGRAGHTGYNTRTFQFSTEVPMMFSTISAFALCLLPGATPQDGKDLHVLVEKLGGKVERLPYPKDEVNYSVDLKGTKVTDDDLVPLTKFKEMKGLDLSFTAVTDKGVEHLVGAAGLRHLDLVGTRVTDAAVKHLRAI